MPSMRMSRMGSVILHKSEFPELTMCEYPTLCLPSETDSGKTFKVPEMNDMKRSLYEAISFGKLDGILG